MTKSHVPNIGVSIRRRLRQQSAGEPVRWTEGLPSPSPWGIHKCNVSGPISIGVHDTNDECDGDFPLRGRRWAHSHVVCTNVKKAPPHRTAHGIAKRRWGIGSATGWPTASRARSKILSRFDSEDPRSEPCAHAPATPTEHRCPCVDNRRPKGHATEEDPAARKSGSDEHSSEPHC